MVYKALCLKVSQYSQACHWVHIMLLCCQPFHPSETTNGFDIGQKPSCWLIVLLWQLSCNVGCACCKCASQVPPCLQLDMSPDWQLIFLHDPLNQRFLFHEALAMLQLVHHPIEQPILTCSMLALLNLLMFMIHLLDMCHQCKCDLMHMPVVVYAMPMCHLLF